MSNSSVLNRETLESQLYDSLMIEQVMKDHLKHILHSFTVDWPPTPPALIFTDSI